tara:strand:- start:513 stop:1211 length:699 start_codon:yes stop_codon:yes gene_type:complete
MKTELVNYESDISLKGYLAYEGEEKKPLVLVVHTWAGKDDFVHKKAESLAELGYVGFAVDMYGDGKTGSDAAENESMMTPLVSDRDLLKARINSALEYGKSLSYVDSSKVAAIGYCFGGLVVLDLARSGANVSGVVSFHGLLMSSDINSSGLKSKVLVLHGERDPMVPLEMVDSFQKEMTEANADWQLHSYGGAYHAFTNPDANDASLGTKYDKNADSRSWQSMINFFEEIF